MQTSMQTSLTSQEPKAGDIVGFSGRSLWGTVINLATYGIPFWDLCHVGVLAGGPDGELLLFESSEYPLPCVIRNKVFRGAQAHHLASIVNIYKGSVWHYPIYRPLYDYESKRLSEFLLSTIGTPYDELGAYRSGGIGLSWVEALLREQDLTSIFCSEWVAAAHAMIGLLQTDNVSRWNPNRLVRYERRAGILRKPRRLK